MIEITIPEINSKEKNVKDLVFSILSDGQSKTISQLHREIKKLYGLSVSFQAVLKAINLLLEKRILTKKDKLYSINEEWIFEARNFLDKMYRIYFNVSEPIKKVELGKEITVYTITNLLELDKLWNDLLTNWSKEESQEKNKINCWQGKHAWWLIPRLQEEDILHDLMEKQQIKTYNLILGKTALDKIAFDYYKNKKENVKIKSMKLEKDFHIAAFGDFILKFEIPKEISDKLERIYQKTNKLEDIKFKDILDIFKQRTEIEITVIKDKHLSSKIQEEIKSYF